MQQPALVATSLAMLAAIREQGIEPDFVVGHSVGEFAALAAVDAMTLEEAIELVRERGLAMAEAARERPGSMAAVLGLEDEVVENLCRKILGVWPANYNCPGQIVVSGEDGAVEELSAEAQSLGARRAIKLKVSGAFHSPLVASAAKRLRPAIERVPFRETTHPFMSTVTARVEPATKLGTLLVDQLTAPVRFTQSAGGLIGEGVKTFVEVGPWQRALRARQADRPQREDGLGQQRRGTAPARREPVQDHVTFASLDGKTALVTGGSRGIGRAIAEELARAGASVVVGYRSGADEAEEVASTIGGRAVQADVSDPEQAKRLVEEAGDLDVLVNNAGLTRDGLIARMPDEDWREVIDTNLGGAFYTCRAATRGMMRKRSGSIVNISSIVGVHGNPGQTNYSAAKAGIIGFTKALARELGSRNVRANVIAPGYIATRLTEVLPEELQQAMLDNTPLGPARRSGRRGRSGTLPRLGRGCLHHRRGAAGRWRPGHVGRSG